MFDPQSKKFTLIGTCFPTHHLAFSKEHSKLFLSAGVVGPGVLGWLDVKKFEETGDEAAVAGLDAFVLDTNGDGKRGEYVEPDKPVEPGKDKRIAVNDYAIAVSPSDGAIWGTVIGYPGSIVRTVLGDDPMQTALSEIYEPPLPGYGPRGGDIDADGVYWVALASGHFGSFDRRKCKVLNGPTATGKHCPEGWTLHQLPGPQIRDVKDRRQRGGELLRLDRLVQHVRPRQERADRDGQPATARSSRWWTASSSSSPCPIRWASSPKNVDGRIDDPKAGWKGTALWIDLRHAAPCFIWKAEHRTVRAWSSCNFARIRSPIKGRPARARRSRRPLFRPPEPY